MVVWHGCRPGRGPAHHGCHSAHHSWCRKWGPAWLRSGAKSIVIDVRGEIRHVILWKYCCFAIRSLVSWLVVSFFLPFFHVWISLQFLYGYMWDFLVLISCISLRQFLHYTIKWIMLICSAADCSKFQRKNWSGWCWLLPVGNFSFWRWSRFLLLYSQFALI